MKLTDYRLADGRVLRVASWIADPERKTLRQAAARIKRELYQRAFEHDRETADAEQGAET